jgi:uncharacterized protein (TIRG00374 family)
MIRNMHPRLATAARAVISLAFVALLVVFARHVQWRATWEQLRAASPRMLGAALVVNLLSLALKGVRWWLFLRKVGSPSFWLAVKATFAGAGLNNVLVANGGQAAQLLLVSRVTGVPNAEVFATLTLDRLNGFVGYVLVLVLGLYVLPLPGDLGRLRPWAAGALIVLTIVMIVLFRLDVGEDAASPDGRRFQRLRDYGHMFLRAVTEMSTGTLFVQALVLSIASWVLQIATFQMTAMAVHFPISVTGSVAAVILVNTGFVFHITPGNVGVFQALYAAAAVAFGLDQSAAIAVAILIQAQQILPVTVLGIGLAPEFLFRAKKSAGAPA